MVRWSPEEDYHADNESGDHSGNEASDGKKEPCIELGLRRAFLRHVGQERNWCIHAEDGGDACPEASRGTDRCGGHIDLEQSIAHLVEHQQGDLLLAGDVESRRLEGRTCSMHVRQVGLEELLCGVGHVRREILSRSRVGVELGSRSRVGFGVQVDSADRLLVFESARDRVIKGARLGLQVIHPLPQLAHDDEPIRADAQLDPTMRSELVEFLSDMRSQRARPLVQIKTRTHEDGLHCNEHEGGRRRLSTVATTGW